MTRCWTFSKPASVNKRSSTPGAPSAKIPGLPGAGEDHDGYLAARLEGPSCRRERCGRFGKEHETKTTGNGIETFGSYIELFRCTGERRDVTEPGGTRILPYVAQHRFGNVACDDVSLGTNATSCFEGLASRTAGEIEDARSRTNSRHIEHGLRGGC